TRGARQHRSRRRGGGDRAHARAGVERARLSAPLAARARAQDVSRRGAGALDGRDPRRAADSRAVAHRPVRPRQGEGEPAAPARHARKAHPRARPSDAHRRSARDHAPQGAGGVQGARVDARAERAARRDGRRGDRLHGGLARAAQRLSRRPPIPSGEGIMAIPSHRNTTFDELAVGQTARIERTVTAIDLYAFAHASGNTNPIHRPDLDRAVPGDVVAPSLWVGSLVSSLLGTILPGAGTLYRGQTFRFLSRAHVGDRLIVSVRCTEKRENPIALFETRVEKSDGT